jgi:hypothetical protein
MPKLSDTVSGQASPRFQRVRVSSRNLPWKLKLETKFARKIGDHDHYVTPWWCSPALLS